MVGGKRRGTFVFEDGVVDRFGALILMEVRTTVVPVVHGGRCNVVRHGCRCFFCEIRGSVVLMSEIKRVNDFVCYFFVQNTYIS